MKSILYILLLTLVMAGCGSNPKQESTTTEPVVKPVAGELVEPAVIVPVFDADSAYNFVAKQVAFGYRVPGTVAHRKCGNYLVNKFKEYGAEVITQDVELNAYNGDKLKARNIIAQFQPNKENRIMLCAHWDTRPWADSDPDKSNHYKPILGANDGGSGVGVLLEIGRQLAAVPAEVGVDIILFDAEDYGIHENDTEKYAGNNNSWALGSQYWSYFPHKDGYRPRYGILLDIVGAPGSTFLHEYHSMQYAPGLVNKVWEWAGKLGYANYFVNEDGGAVTDDHYYVNTTAGIPCIDIINCDYNSPNGFGPHHHTVKDDMGWIDAGTLKAVGQTVMTVIYNEK